MMKPLLRIHVARDVIPWTVVRRISGNCHGQRPLSTFIVHCAPSTRQTFRIPSSASAAATYATQVVQQKSSRQSHSKRSNNPRKKRSSVEALPWNNDPKSTARKSTVNAVPKESDVVRLSKRMSELDICSRREADRYIMEGRVLLQGQVVNPILGQKVPSNEMEIALLTSSREEHHQQRRPLDFSWSHLQTAAVVLHKPVGFVSGQPEGAKDGTQHVPAVRLLTRENAHIVRSNYTVSSTIHNSLYKNADEEFGEAQSIVNDQLVFQLHHHRLATEPTLDGYVPAGRLDLDSSGLLLFTNEGVMAKKCTSSSSNSNGIEKEYYALVEPLQGLTRVEQAAGMTVTDLPQQSHRNLDKMRKGGFRLFGSPKPLRPVVAAEWIHNDEDNVWQTYFSTTTDTLTNPRRRVLRLVLKEGRKHQVRRMCREMLGMHVLHLVRTRIGSIKLMGLPERKWRPLRQEEAQLIYET